MTNTDSPHQPAPRQKRWQDKKRAEGKCIKCGHRKARKLRFKYSPPRLSVYCDHCA